MWPNESTIEALAELIRAGWTRADLFRSFPWFDDAVVFEAWCRLDWHDQFQTLLELYPTGTYRQAFGKFFARGAA